MKKKIVNISFILLIGLFLISAAHASDDSQLNETVSASPTTTHKVSSDLSNDEIQTVFDSANDGDTIEFTSKEYKNVSLVVDKKLNIVSPKGSVVYSSDKVSDRAKNSGIDKTFGFYFTSNSAGSVLSGITIKAPSSDYAIVVDNTKNVAIKNNRITGGGNGVLVKNSEKITLTNNKISGCTNNGLQLQNVKDSVISKNNIWNNGRSGLETSIICDCKILNNTIHHNAFNGISMYVLSSGSIIKFNNVHNNTNGIFINCRSINDIVVANTFSHNRRDPFCELGGDESGNGLLFGDGFRTAKDSSRLLVKDNALIRNEQFQAKNNPANEKFTLDQNWFDSKDDESTFVCPMLVAKILKLDAFTIKNGIGIQVKDMDGNQVKEMGTFDVEVEIDGNKYVAKVQNDGTAKIQSKDLEPNKEYDVNIAIGDYRARNIIKYRVTSGPEKYDDPIQSETQNNEENTGASDSSNNHVPMNGEGTGQGNGEGAGSGDGQGNANSTNSHVTNSGNTGNYGTNSSDKYTSSSSDQGENALSYGDVNAGSSSEGSSGKGSKAYEVVPEQQVNKSIVDTSGAVILSIIALMGMLYYGYRREYKFE